MMKRILALGGIGLTLTLLNAAHAARQGKMDLRR